MAKKETKFEIVTKDGEVWTPPANMMPIDIDGKFIVPTVLQDVRCDMRGPAGFAKKFGSETKYPTPLKVVMFTYKQYNQIRPSEEWTNPADFRQIIGFVWTGKAWIASTVTFSGCSVKDFDAFVDDVQLEHTKETQYFWMSRSLVMNFNKISSRNGKIHVFDFSTEALSKPDLELMVETLRGSRSFFDEFRDLPDVTKD